MHLAHVTLTLLLHPWLDHPPARTLATAIAPPPGYTRVTTGPLGQWLRQLPLLPDGVAVRLHDGTLKRNQSAHAAVVDLDVGRSDLQQCADAVMRLYAEFLWSADCKQDIAFHLTSGLRVAWPDWARGQRVVLRGKQAVAVQTGKTASDRKAFADYLRLVFTYAGTASLAHELPKPQPGPLQPGDVLVQGGHPGHGVLVLDAAEDARGRRVVLVGQSYMPAQQFHVVRNVLDGKLSPWLRAEAIDQAAGLQTPEWPAFHRPDVRRFPSRCATGP